MPAAYLNLSSPVKRETNTYVDQDGVQFSSMLITATAACAPALLPAIGSAYELNANFQVTHSDLAYAANGLATITVNAAGPSAGAKPRYRIIPGAPRIFGLAPGPAAADPNPSAGVTVEVTLIESQASQQSVVSTYNRKAMPSSISGLTLPVPASGPRDLSVLSNFGSTVVGEQYSQIGYYYGFICTAIRMDQRGSALVVVLSFQESGYLQVRTTGGNYETAWSYNL